MALLGTTHGDARAAAEQRGLTPAFQRPPDAVARPLPVGRAHHPAAVSHAMPSDRRRYYLTTAIAYANNKPGLHTLFEVIGADAIARWHRMLGDDTLFLTGTDEHSVNIAQRRPSEGRPPRDVRRREGGALQGGRGRAARSPRTGSSGRPTPTTSAAAQEMVRRAHANGDIYLGTYEGWYCPNEGFNGATDVIETARGDHCPNHPDVPLQWLTERNWFFRLSAYQERARALFRRAPRLRPARIPAQRDARLHPRQGLEDFSISRERRRLGHPVPDRRERRVGAARGRLVGPRGGHDLRLVRRADQLHHRAPGFPDDPEAFAHWWPADLHVIGKDIARFHTIFWPAMLWSAGLEAPRHVWVHGWLLAQGGERMSKSRGNFLDPNDVVAAFGSDGARYVALREVAFDRDTEVCWDSFVRRYNADLANDFGNLVNRTVSMTDRYLDGERPAPRRPGSPLGGAGRRRSRRTATASRGACCTRRWPALWEFVGAANQVVDAEQPWVLAKAARPATSEAAARLRGVLGDLVEACRLLGLAAAPFLPGDRAARPRPARLRLSRTAPTATAARRCSTSSRWGAHAAEPGALAHAEPLFPRLDVEGDAGRRLTATVRASEPCVADAPDRQPLPPPGRPVRGRRRRCPRRGATGRRRADPGPGLERRVVVERALELVDRHPWLDAAVGVHPARRGPGRRRRAGAGSSAWPPTRGSSRSARPGLDYDRVFSPLADQLDNLRRNLALALETGKPAILHCRSADGRARRAGRPGRGAPRGAGVGGAAWAPLSGTARRRSSTPSPGPLDYARDGPRPRPRRSLQRPRLPARRGGQRGGRPPRPARPAAGRDGRALSRSAGRAAPAQRARMGARHRRLGRGAERRGR